MTGYPRDLVGYADQPPDPRWPGGARLALNFVINYEEGGERSVLHGDKVADPRWQTRSMNLDGVVSIAALWFHSVCEIHCRPSE
jgi:hypothetical protein